MMYEDAVNGIEMQCAREYFDADDKVLRATDLITLSKEALKDLPTNNLQCEQDQFSPEQRA